MVPAKKQKRATKGVKAGTSAHKQESMLSILTLENNIPVPLRGLHDPEFVKAIDRLFRDMKPRQSFVVPKPKAHGVKRIHKANHSEILIKSSVIKPEEKFVRFWRLQ